MAGRRANSAVTSRISRRVAGCIGELSSNKGGSSARKAIGSTTPCTPEEERFLKTAVKRVIHRASEVEHGPDPDVLPGDVLSSHKDKDDAWTVFYEAIGEAVGNDIIVLRDVPAQTVLASFDEGIYGTDAA